MRLARGNVYEETDQELLNLAYLEILVPYLNDPSEEATFGSNIINEQHDSMKLENEEVMLKNN